MTGHMLHSGVNSSKLNQFGAAAHFTAADQSQQAGVCRLCHHCCSLRAAVRPDRAWKSIIIIGCSSGGAGSRSSSDRSPLFLPQLCSSNQHAFREGGGPSVWRWHHHRNGAGRLAASGHRPPPPKNMRSPITRGQLGLKDTVICGKTPTLTPPPGLCGNVAWRRTAPPLTIKPIKPSNSRKGWRFGLFKDLHV